MRSSFNNNPGTIVTEETEDMENVVVRGVSIEKNQAKVTIRQVPDRPGTAAKIFAALAATNAILDMIVQSDSVGDTNDISFALNKDELPEAQQAVNSGQDPRGRAARARGLWIGRESVGAFLRGDQGRVIFKRRNRGATPPAAPSCTVTLRTVPPVSETKPAPPRFAVTVPCMLPAMGAHVPRSPVASTM